MSQRERHARKSRIKLNKLDKVSMIRPLARLRGSARRGRSLGRAIFILALSMTISVAAAKEIDSVEVNQKPFNIYNKMNVKLYLHNTIGDWYEFECALDLAYRESSFRYDAVNKTSGAYGLFQHMSEYAPKWDVFTQIDKHKEYIDARYDGSWCKALDHLKGKGWH